MSASHRPTIVVDEVIEDRSQRAAVPAGSSSSPPHVKRYTRGRYLGKGGFAKVYAFTSLDSGREYACKVIPKCSLVKESSRKKLTNEINIHRTIRHSQVVRFERFFEDRSNVYILLELCPHQTMLELIKRRGQLSEVECQYYILQLVLTVQHLHGQAIIHRDLKLGNLFLGEQLDLKVGDFGLATRLEHSEERKRTICGTPNYIAPEILDNSDGHSFEVDVWAIGVILYTLLYGSPPFETSSVKTTYRRIRDNAYSFPTPSDANYRPVTPAAKSLIRRILCTDPKQRPTLSEMRADAFFTQSKVPDRLGVSVLDTPLPLQHQCKELIRMEELKDKEDEQRRKERRQTTQLEGEEAEEVEGRRGQENAAAAAAAPVLKQSPTAAAQPPARAEAAAATAPPRAVLAEKAVNGAPAEGPSTSASVERRALKAAQSSIMPTSAQSIPGSATAAPRPASPQPKGSSRRETLEREREAIIHRLKARTHSSATATALAAAHTTTPATSSSIPSTALPLTSAVPTTATAAVAHPFLHAGQPQATAAVKQREPQASQAASPSPFRRPLTGAPPSALAMSPSARRTSSAAPLLAPTPVPAVSSPTSSAASSSSSAPASGARSGACTTRPLPSSVCPPARANSVSPFPSPFITSSHGPKAGRSTPTTTATATPTPSSLRSISSSSSPSSSSSSSSASASPNSVGGQPSSSPPLPVTPLTWSSSPSHLVSIASAEASAATSAPASSAACEAEEARSALPCESPPPQGVEREVDALRRGREEREIRAKLEDKIDEERRRIRSHSHGRPSKDRTAQKRREKEREEEEEEGSEEERERQREQAGAGAQPADGSTVGRAVSAVGLPRSLPSAALSPSSSSSPSSSPSAPSSSSSRGVRSGASTSPPPAPPLPSVIEESFLAANGEVPGCTPALYVDKWVDYSNKYGLGYLLSDGRVGVYFNDASKAVTLGAGVQCSAFRYIERRSREEGGGEAVADFDLTDHPPALHKKVTLLQHFARYLTQRSSATNTAVDVADAHPTLPSSHSSSSSASLPFVRKWLRTKHAIFFRLSCGSVQVIFNDRTELVVGEGRVAYTDRAGRRVGGALEEVEARKEEGLAKRLRYMREILEHMTSRGSGSSSRQLAQQPQPHSTPRATSGAAVRRASQAEEEAKTRGTRGRV